MANASSAKEWAKVAVKGLWASPPIPFKPDLSLDEAALRHNVDEILARGADGVGFGYAEPWHLTRQERMRCMEIFADAVKHRVPTFVHATDHSAPESVALARHAAAVGIDAVMIHAPYEFAKSQQMAVEYFAYVAANTDIAIFAYHTPHSGSKLTPETIDTISRIPAVAALKNGINDFEHTKAVARLCGSRIVVSEPIEEMLPRAILELDQQVLLGATSVYLTQGPEFKPINEYVEDFRHGRLDAGWSKYHSLRPLRDAWKEMYGSVWGPNGGKHPIALTKVWMDAIGMYGGPVRPPGDGASPVERQELLARLSNTGLLPRLQSNAGPRP